MNHTGRMCRAVCLALPYASAAVHAAASDDASARAAATVAAMSVDERTVLTSGSMALPIGPPHVLPADAVPGAGYVPGIARLGVPALRESDAGLGVSWAMGVRHDGATALPSALAMGASWDPALVERAGAMIGGEARARGFNVLLAGGVNLVRDPRNGRAFEYFGEDPLHSGLMAGASVHGIQSQHVIATVKHYALNAQETGRQFMSANIGDAAARASDLLAFQIAIERGQPGAVMCGYNRVNHDWACGNPYLLTTVLKRDWAYPGWVMSDWGAVHGLDAALHGLDQQSAAQIDDEAWLGEPLARAARTDPAYAARLTDMNRRILRSIYAVGVDRHPPEVRPLDYQADGDVAEAVARAGLVLLRNQGGALPLAPRHQRVAVIGGYADSGVLAGGGSSLVHGEGGPAITVPLTNAGMFAALIAQTYHHSVPLAALRARAPDTEFEYRDGHYVSEAVQVARAADVVLVFATEWRTEGYDVPDLSLPDGQDALISALAAANPRTIVVLESGGPVLMPWLERCAAVVEAWYPGARGAEAIAALLYGDLNPSGRLPVTFPASVAQLPRPALPGADTVEPGFAVRDAQATLDVDYDVEGADVGYRWFARQAATPLFPFGYGLSYTSYVYSKLSASGGVTPSAEVTVRNSGTRAGTETAQLYLVEGPQGHRRRLLGWARLSLQPGASRAATIDIDRRVMADYDSAAHRWRIAPGDYTFAVGPSSAELPLSVHVKLGAASFAP